MKRIPLRAKGLLAILGVLVPALLVVTAALLFRGAVEGQLDAMYRALEARGVPRSEFAQYLVQARQYIDGGTVAIACVAWLGITSLGAFALLFFSRLAQDIGTVRGRALAIVTGERGQGQPLARNDELSDLAQAVDDLAAALARRESDLQIERQHALHHERLAAIGTMAAGVLREIGNPIAAIDGYARALVEAQRAGGAPLLPQEAWFDPKQILGETARLVAITHEISELAAAPAAQWQLASLNEVVAQSLALLRYEPRLEGIETVTRLDPQLPALDANADRLVLLVTNLVINAADATLGLPPRSGRIELSTRPAGGGVELGVRDNGCGMTDEVLQRAFEPLYTTKPGGSATGLGLPLVRAIAQEHGGRVALYSQPGQGTTVTVWLPLEGATR